MKYLHFFLIAITILFSGISVEAAPATLKAPLYAKSKSKAEDKQEKKTFSALKDTLKDHSIKPRNLRFAMFEDYNQSFLLSNELAKVTVIVKGEKASQLGENLRRKNKKPLKKEAILPRFKRVGDYLRFAKNVKKFEYDGMVIPAHFVQKTDYTTLINLVTTLTDKVPFIILQSRSNRDFSRSNKILRFCTVDKIKQVDLGQNSQLKTYFLIPKYLKIGKSKFTSERLIQHDKGGNVCFFATNNTFIKYYIPSLGGQEVEETPQVENKFYTKAAKTNLKGVPKKLAYVHNSDFSAIATTKVRGKSLNHAGKLSKKDFFHIIRMVNLVLCDFEKKNITHGAVNRRNTMYDKKTGKVSLIDFECADTTKKQTTEPLLRLTWEIMNYQNKCRNKNAPRIHFRKSDEYGFAKPIAKLILDKGITSPNKLKQYLKND